MADKGFSALVVDDNKRHRQLIGAILGSLGARVDLARDGREAVDIAKATPFNLILMDVAMPELDGLTATRLIREHEAATSRAPANNIVITSHDRAEDMARSRAAGADHHLPKPLSPADLVCALDGVAWL